MARRDNATSFYAPPIHTSGHQNYPRRSNPSRKREEATNPNSKLSGRWFRSGVAGYAMRLYDRACWDRIGVSDATHISSNVAGQASSGKRMTPSSVCGMWPNSHLTLMENLSPLSSGSSCSTGARRCYVSVYTTMDCHRQGSWYLSS